MVLAINFVTFGGRVMLFPIHTVHALWGTIMIIDCAFLIVQLQVDLLCPNVECLSFVMIS